MIQRWGGGTPSMERPLLAPKVPKVHPSSCRRRTQAQRGNNGPGPQVWDQGLIFHLLVLTLPLPTHSKKRLGLSCRAGLLPGRTWVKCAVVPGPRGNGNRLSRKHRVVLRTHLRL